MSNTIFVLYLGYLFRSVYMCVCVALVITHTAHLHCTLSSAGFCSGELIVLLFAAEMDRSAGRQRLAEFYSAIHLPKCAFIASVTPIINYLTPAQCRSRRLLGQRARLQGAPWLRAVVVTAFSVCLLRSIVSASHKHSLRHS